MGGGRSNTIQIPHINTAPALARFKEAAKIQETQVRKGLEFYEESLQSATDEMRKGYDSANKTLAPLSEASNAALSESMKLLGLGEDAYTPSEVSDRIAETPGYQFQLDQGTKAIERQGAARGMLGSGNTLMALQDYGQQLGMGYFQGYLQNLNSITEGGKAATAAISDNQVGQGQIESQQAMMLGNARRGAEMNVGTIQADERYRSANTLLEASRDNNNNAYRYFATLSNKAAQDYSTTSRANTAAANLGFQQQKFQYKQNQGIDAFNQLSRSNQQNTGLRNTSQGWLS